MNRPAEIAGALQSLRQLDPHERIAGQPLGPGIENLDFQVIVFFSQSPHERLGLGMRIAGRAALRDCQALLTLAHPQLFAKHEHA